jgi:hypothetical protein
VNRIPSEKGVKGWFNLEDRKAILKHQKFLLQKNDIIEMIINQIADAEH